MVMNNSPLLLKRTVVSHSAWGKWNLNKRMLKSRTITGLNGNKNRYLDHSNTY
uniref:Uncharacterized protein n=1 Tax=Arion vulgaris TaxID=1028688 RepID=A0A0B7AVX5_9EUPU